ncbi:hypothetical protein ATL17_2124 [Maritalea mobilis]|uniref:Uncharacterized protein n=1 Tax=Maritalea mobilis TaxID=483324 RepID=A0A4R6VV57_9HYPH|nr:DUF6713 family protein [Maritalea mobilis]TDQ64111.1 hypothetical protein ATL17_2124 [Maritalea mobilis]
MADWVFLTCYALMIGHELDAIQQKEWRIFPGTNLLPDQMGFQVFTVLHVPLFVLLNWLFFLASAEVMAKAKIGFAIFAILHIGAHWLYRHHQEYRFHSPLSKFLIWAPGCFGLIYLALTIF